MLHSLLIRNFKCFESLDLPLGSLTLLAGINGSGKSSVLQAMLLLRQSMTNTSLAVPPLVLNGEFMQIGTADDAIYSGAVEPMVEFTLKAVENSSATFQFKQNELRPDILEPVESNTPLSDLMPFNLFRDEFQYLNAERIGPRTSFPMSDYSVRRMRTVGSRGEYTSHFLSVYGSEKVLLKALLHPNAVAEDLIAQVEAWFDMICPGTRLRTTAFPGMDIVQLQYHFTAGRDVTDHFRPTNVGFGLTYTLPILAAILASKKGGLVMIENPEAHLHPHGQARMGEFLAKAAGAGIQIILETHSDHILNGIRLAVREGDIPPEQVQLHFFRRAIVYDQEQLIDKPSHTCVSPKLDHNGRMDQRPDGFFDEWDKSLRRMLQPAAKNK